MNDDKNTSVPTEYKIGSEEWHRELIARASVALNRRHAHQLARQRALARLQWVWFILAVVALLVAIWAIEKDSDLWIVMYVVLFTSMVNVFAFAFGLRR